MSASHSNMDRPSARLGRALAGLAAALALAAPGTASAWERLDHRGQPSITLSPGYEHLIRPGRSGEKTTSSPGGFAELAFGLPGGDDGGEGLFGLRWGAGQGGESRLVAPFVAYRIFAGDEEWKTFFDVGAFARIQPVWAVGARLGAGVQYDFTQSFGAFFAAGGAAGLGDGLQVGFDAGLGLQLRFGTPGQ
ncbi:MAG TPA: hypothetical protein VN033_14450 [Vulgatibacter sp.]|nr:hypothetical protein [Vulgatibacter sp.]